MNLEETIVEKVFTEVEEEVNAKVNKLTVKCIDSENNKFSLDCEGNLIVNSITTSQETGTNTNVSVDTIYPIGSIYMNVTSINPATIFGGTWERIEDRFLLSAGPNHENGTFGGEENHQHTINSHIHSINGHNHYLDSHSHGIGSLYAKIQNTAGKFRITRKNVNAYTTGLYVNANPGYFEDKYDNVYGTEIGGWLDGSGVQYTSTIGTTNTNECGVQTSNTSSNMPPYLTVYMWKRVA